MKIIKLVNDYFFWQFWLYQKRQKVADNKITIWETALNLIQIKRTFDFRGYNKRPPTILGNKILLTYFRDSMLKKIEIENLILTYINYSDGTRFEIKKYYSQINTQNVTRIVNNKSYKFLYQNFAFAYAFIFVWKKSYIASIYIRKWHINYLMKTGITETKIHDFCWKKDMKEELRLFKAEWKLWFLAKLALGVIIQEKFLKKHLI